MVDRASTEERSTFSRRRMLGVGGVVGLTFLSGCTREVVEEFPKNTKWPISELSPDLPVHERSDVYEERIHAMSDANIESVEGFASALEAVELEVKSVEEDRDVLSIELQTTVRAEAGVLNDLAMIAGAYAVLVESGYDAYALAASFIPPGASSYGSASIESKLAKRFNTDELTASEYGELVSKTLESHRTRPEVGVDPNE